MKTKISTYFIIFFLFETNLYAQSISGDTWITCPKNSTEETYQAMGFGSDCNYNWQVTNGTVVGGITSSSITVKWDQEPSYVNGPDHLYTNQGNYPVGSLKVTSSNCDITKTENVTIKSVKDYKIYSLIATYNASSYYKRTGESINLTNLDGNISIDLSDNYIYYPSSSGSVAITDFQYTLPSDWEAVGHSEQSFIAGATINLIPPSSHSYVGELRKLKVKIVAPQYCENATRYGEEFELNLRKDPPKIYSLTPSISEIPWGASTDFIVTASTNNISGTQYVWNLPNGYERTSTHSTVEITTNTPTLDVTFLGCNTIEKITVRAEKADYSSTVTQLSGYTIVYPELSGQNTTVCASGGKTFTVSNLPSECIVNWDYSSNMTPNSVNNNTISLRAINSSVNGSGTVTATINSSMGCNTTLQQDVWVNTKPPTISPPCDPITNNWLSRVYTGRNYNFWGLVNGEYIHDNPSNYFWTVMSTDPESMPYMFNGEMITYTATTPGTHTFKLRYYGECGWSPDAVSYVNFIDNGYFSIEVSPNPASDIVEVELKEEEGVKLSEKTKNKEITIQLYNNMQIPIYTNSTHQNKFSINVSDLATGIYHLLIIRDGKKYNKQILVQH